MKGDYLDDLWKAHQILFFLGFFNSTTAFQMGRKGKTQKKQEAYNRFFYYS